MKGEFIVYTTDSTGANKIGVKFGDGVTRVGDLDFIWTSEGSNYTDLTELHEHIANQSNPHKVTAEQVGAVTHDALNQFKPMVVLEDENNKANFNPQDISFHADAGGEVYLRPYE